MIEWDEPRLKELVRKMGLRRTPGQGKTPIRLSLYGPSWNSEPLLTKIMRLDTNAWAALGYTETDRISVTRYLGSLGCRTDYALSEAATYQQPLPFELAKALIDAGAFDKEALPAVAANQQPLTPELAKLLIDAGALGKNALSHVVIYQKPLTLELAKLLIDSGAFDDEALSYAAEYQQPLTFELAKLLVDTGAFDDKALRDAAYFQQPLPLELARLLISAGCDPAAQDDDGRDALVFLAIGGHLADPQVTNLFLSAGCRTNLDGCDRISDEHRLDFNQILKEQWKENLDRMSAEHSPTDAFYGPDWSR